MPMRPLAAALLAAALLAGCGDSGSSRGSGAGSYSEPPPQEPASADPGCTPSHPRRLANTGELAGFFTTCATEDGTSLVVVNVSSAVLRVRAAASTAPAMSAEAPAPESFADSLVGQAQSTWCASGLHVCWMTPGGSVTATDGAPVGLTLDVDEPATASVTAAAMFGSWIEERVTSPPRRFAGAIEDCADAVRKLASPQQLIEDTIRSAVRSSSACGGLVQSVMDELGRSEAQAAATDDAVRLAGKFTTNLRRDLYVLGAIKVLGRLHG